MKRDVKEAIYNILVKWLDGRGLVITDLELLEESLQILNLSNWYIKG